MTQLKTDTEIAAMRQGGKLLATVFGRLEKYVQAGMDGLEIDAWVERQIRSLGARPVYRDPDIGFPGVICISINDVVVHGIPTGYKLRQGDIVSFDLVIDYQGMKTDSAFTMVVGKQPSGDAKRLVEATKRSLYAGIKAIKPGAKTGDIAAAIEGVLNTAKLGIVRDLVGHGIGHFMHEDPEVPNYGRPGTGVALEPGMTIAIEPMATLGTHRVVMNGDGWTILTADGSLSAHFEHTVLVTPGGAEILTTV